jgi:hypothetical protein
MSLGTVGISTIALAATLCATEARPASAQCCEPVPTVAYSPVVVQPQTTVVRTGWYPGYLLDRLRLRRWTTPTTVAAVPAVTAAPTYSVGYAPAYTAAYAPATYTAAYAPPTYTASYTPYITAYAPLQTPVVQTVPAVSSGCSTCAQTTTVSYAPSTVYRPVELTPVVSTPACSTCSVAAPCGACSACSTTVSQASYVEGAAPADCPGCAVAAGTPQYYPEATSQPPTAPAQGSPATPQPALKPEVAAPPASTYGEPTNGANSPSQEKSVMPGPADPAEEDAAGPEADPAADSSTYFEAPPLLGPQNDRTANRPTVDVHNAVYSRPARQAARVSTTAAKVAPAVDANGWYAVD